MMETTSYTRGAVEKLIEQLRKWYGQVAVTETNEGWTLRFEANGNGVEWTLQKVRKTAE